MTPRRLKQFRTIVFAATCILAAVSNIFTPLHSSPFIRKLLSVDEEQLFQVTITGVPNRLPTLAENMVLEAALLDYLKFTLATSSSNSGISIYSVRVKGDKTIHYRRSLNEDEQEFSIVGESFPSNGEIELDAETLDHIDVYNERILGLYRNEDTVHQLSLLILIKGSHEIRTNYAVDFDEVVMKAINTGNSKIISELRKYLMASTTDRVSNEAAAYFLATKTILCIGVGPRNVDGESYLEMENHDEDQLGRSATSPKSFTTIKDALFPKFAMSSSSDSSTSNTNPAGKEEIISGYDLQESYNTDAIKFRQVSSIFFIVICSIAGVWYFGKMAAKKHEERQKKMSLAKKAYEGPGKKGLDGGRYNDHGKFTGTMDTVF